MYTNLIKFIRDLYGTQAFIPLHAPTFTQRDKDCVMDAIDSTFVSSVGQYVNRFEQDLAAFTGAARAVATANAIAHLGAAPVFVDVDKDTMGLSPDAVLLVAAGEQGPGNNW
jgi:dTDP-4-amino-4,6-dideoxygalactose transaminase